MVQTESTLDTLLMIDLLKQSLRWKNLDGFYIRQSHSAARPVKQKQAQSNVEAQSMASDFATNTKKSCLLKYSIETK